MEDVDFSSLDEDSGLVEWVSLPRVIPMEVIKVAEYDDNEKPDYKMLADVNKRGIEVRVHEGRYYIKSEKLHL